MIAFLTEEEGFAIVADLFEQCAEGNRNAYMSVINLGEVYYHALRTGGEKKADVAMELIKMLPIAIIDVGRDLTLQAARYKAFHKMSYADAFAAALTKLKKASLYTGDKEFKVLENEIKINWL